MLRSNLKDALKVAQKAQDKRATSTLRLILAALKDRDIAARGKGVDDGIGDDEILSMLQTMIKQRHDSIEHYEQGGRLELAEQEREEIRIIQDFLPRQLSEEEIAEAVAAVLREIGAAGLKDMGKAMAALKTQYAGQMDFAKASAVAKARLGAG